MAEQRPRRLSSQFENYDQHPVRHLSIAEAVAGVDNPNVLSKNLRKKHLRRSTAFELKEKLRQSFLQTVQTTKPELQEQLLPALTTIDHIFIAPASTVLPLQNAFELLDSNGKRLYFIGELLGETGDGWSNHRDLDIVLLGKEGGLLCNITGSTKQAAVEDSRMVNYGTLEAAGKGYEARPSHVTVDGDHFQFLPQSVDSPADHQTYKIVSKTSGMGEVKGRWPHSTNERFRDTYGIRLLPQLAPETKLLLLSTFLVLFFLHHVRTSSGSKRRDFWAGLCYSVVVGVLVTAMAVVVIYCALQTPKT